MGIAGSLMMMISTAEIAVVAPMISTTDGELVRTRGTVKTTSEGTLTSWTTETILAAMMIRTQSLSWDDFEKLQSQRFFKTVQQHEQSSDWLKATSKGDLEQICPKLRAFLLSWHKCF